jgi:protein AroM
MITVGQSPRDDLVPYMEEVFTRKVPIWQGGVLDGLSREAMADLAPDPGETPIVALLRDGTSTTLSHKKILPRVQSLVNDAVAVFPSIVSALATGWKLGVIKPSAGQLDAAKKQFADRGIDAIVTAASPYTGAQRLRDVRTAAETLRDAGVDLVWMTCVGMDEAMRGVVQEVMGKPVILARTILARILDEFLAAGKIAVS